MKKLTEEEKELARERGAVWWIGMVIFSLVMGLVGWGVFQFLAAAFR